MYSGLQCALCVYAQHRELFMCTTSSLSCTIVNDMCALQLGVKVPVCSAYGQFTRNRNKRKMNIYTNNLQIAYA